jgi:phage shock protein PspC (stress-responsive transcriptional regulator)
MMYHSEGDLMKRLYLSNSDRKISGLCGGLGAYFEIDSTIVRLLVVILCIATAFFPVFLGYLLGWIIIPRAPLQQNPA